MCCRGKGLPSVLEASTDAPFASMHDYAPVPNGTGHAHHGLPAVNAGPNGTAASTVPGGTTTVV